MKVKGKKVQFLVSFTVDENNPKTDKFLRCFKGILNNSLTDTDEILGDSGEIDARRLEDNARITTLF